MFNGTVLSHLPKPARTGHPRCDDRSTINGILFVLTTGCRWADMSDRYGSKSTAHLRFSTAAKGNMEKDSVRTDQIYIQTGKNQPAKNFS